MIRNLKTGYLLILTTIALFSCTQPAQKPADTEADPLHVHKPKGPRGYVQKVNSGVIAVDTMKGSPPMIAMESVNRVHVHITYNSPGVKGRVIWGGLVPYGRVWATGAHYATTINFNTQAMILGNKIPAGTYALFTIPGKKSWTVILNRRVKQHMSDNYQQKEDLCRFKIVPQKQQKEVHRLLFKVEEKDDVEGLITMEWEKIKISIPFSKG